MNWHYLENNQPRGPVSEEEFSSLVQQGVIRPETPIWCEGMADWKSYGELLAPRAASQASPSAPVTTPAPAVGGLRVHREAAHTPAATREATCSHCGAVVSASEIMTVGSAQLCPQCQAAHRRLSLGEARPMVYAPPLLRLAAYLLDLLLCLLTVGVIISGGAFLLGLFGVPERTANFIGLGLVLVALVWVWDYFIGRIARYGATPMMRVFKIQVVTTTGGPVSGWRALGRFLMIGLVTHFTFTLGHIVAFFDKQRRSLHDLACGTVVIRN